MTPRFGRVVWTLGILAYLAGGVFFAFTPVVLPFLGVVVLLICMSVAGKADDPVVLRAVVVQAVFAGLVMVLFASRRQWEWTGSIGKASYILGAILPIAIIVYRIVRPHPVRAAGE